MAKRQLRELQRLMAWSWDSRVDEHPPGEKAMQDFENVLTFQMDGRRRRTHAAKLDPSSAGSPAAPSSGSGAKPARRTPAERGVKRAASAGPGEGGAAPGSKLPRLDPAATTAVPAPEQGRQQQPRAVVAAAPAQHASHAAVSAAAASQKPVGGVAGLAASPAAAADATPAAVRQQVQQHSPALPPSCSAVTPAVLLAAGTFHTPPTEATGASVPATAGITAAALADGQCLPTPAAMPLPPATVACPASVAVLPAPAQPAEAAGAAVPPRQPAPRSLMTSRKGGRSPAPAPALPAGEGVEQAGAEAPRAETALARPGSCDSAAALDVAADLLALAASPLPPPARPAERSEPSMPEQAAAPEPCAGQLHPQPIPSAAPHQPAPAAELTPVVQAQPPAAPSPAASAPAHQKAAALAAPAPAAATHACAAGQLVYHQPRPSSCPPLFKRQHAGQLAVAAAAQGSKSASRAEPRASCGEAQALRASPGSLSASKENVSHNVGATPPAPRTAEPAAPQPTQLSSWKQAQLQQLSAGFHSRQRRLLDLLSASGRSYWSPLGAASAGESPARAAQQAGRTGRGVVAAAPGIKPPLGPRAAAVAMGRTLGRLKEQQAL